MNARRICLTFGLLFGAACSGSAGEPASSEQPSGQAGAVGASGTGQAGAASGPVGSGGGSAGIADTGGGSLAGGRPADARPDAAGGAGGGAGSGDLAGAGGAAGGTLPGDAGSRDARVVGDAGPVGADAEAGAQPYKGVANAACADLTKLDVSWWYNWTANPGRCAAGEFVPMISGKNEKTETAVSSAIAQVAKAGYRAVLAFNEPNKPDQANLTVAQVLNLWPAVSANGSIRVSTPATSADGQAWFNDFMAKLNAQSLRADFVAIHWYGWNAGSCDAKAATLEYYLKWAEGATGNRPIWITEWGCMNQSAPDMATVQAFLTGALTMLERHPRVQRHAWYPWLTHNELVNADGTLTALGAVFAAARSRT